MEYEKASNTAFLRAVFWVGFGVLSGWQLLSYAREREQPQYEWAPGVREKSEEYDQKANGSYAAVEAARELQAETGDRRWGKVAGDTEKRFLEQVRANPYRPKEIKQPRQTGYRVVGWVTILGGFAIAVAVFRRGLAQSDRLYRKAWGYAVEPNDTEGKEFSFPRDIVNGDRDGHG